VDYRASTPWLLGGILMLTGVGIVYAMRQGAGVCNVSVRPGDRVLLFGDSLAVGLSAPFRSVAKQGGCDFTSQAETSTSMAQWLSEPRQSQLQALMASFQPTVVLVSLGTNDSKGNAETSRLAAQIVQIRDWIASTGAKLVWVLPPKLPFPERVSAGVRAAGIDGFPSANLPLPQVDGIHLTGRGYAGWAEHIWAFLSCSPTPSDALAGLGAALHPVLPSFMVPARPARVQQTTQAQQQMQQRSRSNKRRRGKKRRMG